MLTPRAAAIHDMSGFGRCSLTVAIPVLSAMGVQCCPLPTAFLSTHTGGFTGFTFLDMTEEMPKIAAHWQELDLRFHAIYSGFLASERQIGIVSDFIRTFRRSDTLVVIDPVMGDGGSLYSSISKDMIGEMRRLIGEADLIVPNQTEAAFLLGEDPASHADTPEDLKRRLRALADLGPKTVLLTSAEDRTRPGEIGVAAYEKQSGRYWRVFSPKLQGSYPGTGDIFASVMLGSLLQGNSLP